jgi:hypothetical protein
MANEERLQILDMIAQGKITAQQGIELLNALAEDAGQTPDLPTGEPAATETQPSLEPETRLPEVIPVESTPPVAEAFAGTEAGSPAPEAIPTEPAPPVAEAVAGAETEAPTPEATSAAPLPPENPSGPTIVEEQLEAPAFDPRAKKWRGWWRIPLWIGVIATILTGLLLYAIYDAGGFNFWFACAWFPFLLSVAIIALAWASRSAHWIHVRVHQSPGERPQNIAISLPVPITLMGWFLRTFRGRIPGIQGVNPDEMILALKHVSPEKPFYVEVNEDDGERVEVYIG